MHKEALVIGINADFGDFSVYKIWHFATKRDVIDDEIGQLMKLHHLKMIKRIKWFLDAFGTLEKSK